MKPKPSGEETRFFNQAYALLHMSRKALSEVKSTLIALWSQPGGDQQLFHGDSAAHSAKTFSGTLDLVFMWTYAAGLVLLGDVGDRLNLRWVLAVAMCLSGIVTALFGLGPYWTQVQSPAFYATVWGLNGFAQSACWPAVVAIVGNWLGKGVRGGVMGLWSGNASAGNGLGDLLGFVVLQHTDLGWQWCLLISGMALFLGGIVIAVALRAHPNDVGLPAHATARGLEDGDPDEDEVQHEGQDDIVPMPSPGLYVGLQQDPGGGSTGVDQESQMQQGLLEADGFGAVGPSSSGGGYLKKQGTHQGETEEEEKGEGGAIGLWAALMLPGTIVFSLCYMALKSTNYAYFFWLPDYLQVTLHEDSGVANLSSLYYDIGGIMGGFIAGMLTDCVARRSPIVVGQIGLAVPLILVFGLVAKSKLAVVATSAAVGLMLGGAANLISSVFAVEIGEEVARQERKAAMKGSANGAPRKRVSAKRSLATVAGIIDGAGSLGAGAVLQIVGLLPTDKLSYLLAPLTAVSALCLVGVLVKDLRAMTGCCGGEDGQGGSGRDGGNLKLTGGAAGLVEPSDRLQSSSINGGGGRPSLGHSDASLQRNALY